MLLSNGFYAQTAHNVIDVINTHYSAGLIKPLEFAFPASCAYYFTSMHTKGKCLATLMSTDE